MEEPEENWKLKLRYGKRETPYHHFTVIAKGLVGELTSGFNCPKGNAFMGMKMWAESAEQAGDMIQTIGRNIGFTVTDKI